MTNYLKNTFNLNSDELVELFDELPLWAAPFGLKLLDNIHYKKNITALDIGFGAGFPLTELAMRLGTTSKVYGVDPWEAAVNRTEKKVDFYGIKNIEIIRGYAENLALKTNSIDLIVSNNGLNNVADLDKSLSECARIIKSGGQFVQTMNLNASMAEFYQIMEHVLVELKLDDAVALMHKQIYNKRKPLDAYCSMIRKHGFSVEAVLHDTFEYKFVDGTTMLNHFFIRLAFIDGWKSFIPGERQEEIFTLVENKMNEQSAKQGIFILSIPFVLIDCKKV